MFSSQLLKSKRVDGLSGKFDTSSVFDGVSLKLGPIPKSLLLSQAPPTSSSTLWSRELEAVFKEAYHLFQELDEAGDDLCELLGKNEFISRYIYKVTGEVRNRKQIAGRCLSLMRREQRAEKRDVVPPQSSLSSGTIPKISIKLNHPTHNFENHAKSEQQLFPDYYLSKITHLFPANNDTIKPSDIFSSNASLESFYLSDSDSAFLNTPPMSPAIRKASRPGFGSSEHLLPSTPIFATNHVKTTIKRSEAMLFTPKTVFSAASESRVQLTHQAIVNLYDENTASYHYHFQSTFQSLSECQLDIITTVVSFGRIILQYAQKYSVETTDPSQKRTIVCDNTCVDMFLDFFVDELKREHDDEKQKTILRNLTICQTLLQTSSATQTPQLEIVTTFEPNFY